MKMRLKCEEPKQVVYTITCTATAAEWENFRECLYDFTMKSLRLLFRGATEIGVPVLYQPFLTNKFFCDAELMRKWRASQTTSGAKP